MTEQEQRIAIAQFCGWKKTPDEHAVYGYVWESPTGDFCGTSDGLPDYTNDLNAMHDAEARVADKKTLVQCLESVVALGTVNWHKIDQFEKGFAIRHATPTQRAEALLRATGKWIQSTNEEHTETIDKLKAQVATLRQALEKLTRAYDLKQWTHSEAIGQAHKVLADIPEL